MILGGTVHGQPIEFTTNKQIKTSNVLDNISKVYTKKRILREEFKRKAIYDRILMAFLETLMKRTLYPKPLQTIP